jgi:hypothetical protein
LKVPATKTRFSERDSGVFRAGWGVDPVADSIQIRESATTRQVELRDRQFMQPASCYVNTTAYLSSIGA